MDVKFDFHSAIHFDNFSSLVKWGIDKLHTFYGNVNVYVIRIIFFLNVMKNW